MTTFLDWPRKYIWTNSTHQIIRSSFHQCCKAALGPIFCAVQRLSFVKGKMNGIHSKQLLPAKGLESLPKFIIPNPTNPPKLLVEIFVPLGSKSLVTKIDQGPFKLRTNSWPLLLSLSHRSALTIVWQRDQHQDQTSSHGFSSISRPSGISPGRVEHISIEGYWGHLPCRSIPHLTPVRCRIQTPCGRFALVSRAVGSQPQGD